MSKRRRRSIRHFLLLEVVVALSIASCCLIPLVRTQLGCARHELAKLQELQMEQVAQETFWSVRELLYAKKINWSDLNYGKVRPKVVTQSLEPVRMNMGGTYLREFTIGVAKEHKKSDRAKYRLYEVVVRVKRERGQEKSFHYDLYAERLNMGVRQA